MSAQSQPHDLHKDAMDHERTMLVRLAKVVYLWDKIGDAAGTDTAPGLSVCTEFGMADEIERLTDEFVAAYRARQDVSASTS